MKLFSQCIWTPPEIIFSLLVMHVLFLSLLLFLIAGNHSNKQNFKFNSNVLKVTNTWLDINMQKTTWFASATFFVQDNGLESGFELLKQLFDIRTRRTIQFAENDDRIAISVSQILDKVCCVMMRFNQNKIWIDLDFHEDSDEFRESTWRRRKKYEKEKDSGEVHE